MGNTLFLLSGDGKYTEYSMGILERFFGFFFIFSLYFSLFDVLSRFPI